MLHTAVFLASASSFAQLPSSAEVVVGDVRVQAYSPTLLRVEPRGPLGFENRSTFFVVPGGRSSFGAGEMISVVNTTTSGAAWLATASGAALFVAQSKGEVTELRLYSAPTVGAALLYSCRKDPLLRPGQGCVAADANHLVWPSPGKQPAYALVDRPRFFAPPWGVAPAPADAPPIAPALAHTSGYDFRNDVDGDTYLFVLGSDLPAWHAARATFVQLAGPCPLLPDWAYGTWFTYWHSYTVDEAKDDIAHWDNGSLPLDVWGLDMNWRNTSSDNLLPGESGSQDRYYDHPNTLLFPNMSEWFGFLKAKGLKTYFNDHPYPVDAQTSPAETAFRWAGLSKWLDLGLDFWWFDRNWQFSIPPPNTKKPVLPYEGGEWEGLRNAPWGSHVYHTSVSEYYRRHPSKAGERPVTLTKMATNSNPPFPDPNVLSRHHEVPGQHKYPVWWTGDNVPLKDAVHTMVDQGVSAFKPFVHSDCGGDYRGKSGDDLLRWVQVCCFGTIVRLHGNDHRPWTYGSATEDVVRTYLNIRYALLPSLIAGGQAATATGFPLAARADLFWPEHAEAASNAQYLHLNDTLVAPLWTTRFDGHKNMTTTRSVWFPPGEWTDAWTGTVVAGPKSTVVTQPPERLPMWHRAGGLLVTAPPALRVATQDWSELTLEAFPTQCSRTNDGTTVTTATTQRFVYERGSAARTSVNMHLECAMTAAVSTTDSSNSSTTAVPMPTGSTLRLSIARDDALATARAWVLRVHLRPGQRAKHVTLQGRSGVASTIAAQHIAPLLPGSSAAARYRPFGGAGAAPPPHAGHVLQINVPLASDPLTVIASFQ